MKATNYPEIEPNVYNLKLWLIWTRLLNTSRVEQSNSSINKKVSKLLLKATKFSQLRKEMISELWDQVPQGVELGNKNQRQDVLS